MDRLYLTKDGYNKIRTELERLRTRERPAVIEAISRAREHGDLSENAEYHSAKERQMFIEKKIAELQDKLVRSEIIDESLMDKDKAYLGATVTLKDRRTGEQIRYTLVSTDEADFEQNKISTQSPVGRALLGKGVGEQVEAKVPVGTLAYEILDISRD
ncbi:MAG: transcription elongation factor GreA [Gemmatimonadetes bacterium]|nr:transcription elongation factor GreA [Gemmatimonadota bacterium]MDE3257030.1 transcription elongation factor GreA [Gemmatimonadota bacterium]